jgi:hypothetical protein
MEPSWKPFQEPLRATLFRNGAIAIVAGFVITRFWGGSLGRWPLATILALWPALGGHYVEVCFLNLLRPRISAARGVQVAARIAVWFVGGVVLGVGVVLTATVLTRFRPQWPWWYAGLGFIGIELVVHLALQFRGRANFHNGRA